MSEDKQPIKVSKVTKTTKSPTKPRAKQLNLKQVENIYNDYNKMSSYVFDKEKNIQIKYYPVFTEDRIDDVLDEVQQAMKYVDEEKLDFFQDDSVFMKYVFLMVIKHMTALRDEIPGVEDMATQFSVLNQLIGIGLVRKMFDEVFEGEEVLKIMDRLTEYITLNEKIDNAVLQEFKRLEGINNKEILTPYNVLVDKPQDKE